MNNDIRFVPVQKICLLCPNELQDSDRANGLSGRLCRECIQLIREQVFREVVANPMIVQMQ
jgi:hypothetical protein